MAEISFKARGKERETRVTAFDRGKRIALTSTQAGVTATYTYAVDRPAMARKRRSRPCAMPMGYGSCSIP